MRAKSNRYRSALAIYHQFKADTGSLITFYLRDNREIRGRIRGYFRDEDDNIWQWAVIPDSEAPFSIFNAALLIKHSDIAKVVFHNSGSEFHIHSL